MFKPIAFILAFLWALPLNSQSYIKDSSKKLQSKFAKSAELAAQKKFEEAIKLCDQILKKENDNIDVLLRQSTYFSSLKNLDLSELGFAKAIKLNPDYDARMYYSLGRVQFEAKKYTESSSNFDMFLEKNKKKSKLIKKAQSLRDRSKFIAEAIKNPVPFNPIRMGSEINTDKWECLPVLSADGSSLLYLTIDPSERDPSKKQRLYSAKYEGDSFLQGNPFEGFHYPFGEGAHSLSAGGKIIVFTSCDFGNSQKRTSLGGCDLYISYLKDGIWTTPRNLGSNINTRYWDSQPSLSADNNTLYFASKRKGGLGGSDIYKSIKRKNGEWSKAINLGKTINTSGDDESPFLHPDNETFYFRSNGRVGMGDFDLYVSKKDKDNWSEVKNLGYPINTIDDDGALFVSLNGEKAFFTSNRKKSTDTDQNKNLDIFYFDLPKDIKPTPTTFVKGKIVDAVSKKAITCTIEIASDQNTQLIQTDPNAEFLITLATKKNYSFYIEKDGYVFHSDRFELKDVKTAEKAFELIIELIPIEQNEEIVNISKEKPVILRNIFFESGKHSLLDQSLVEVKKLAQMLNENPSMVIEISGHTDDVGQEIENQKLSENRALSVKNALIEFQCNPNQIQTKGSGESKPIASNETPEGRKVNRRTEFIILKK